MELLRILPGVVVTDQDSLESVSNGGGANNTNGYNVNGVRGSNNVITLDGSRMIDIGSNNGLIIAPNNDFVAEVKIQSSNYAAEFGIGRHTGQRHRPRAAAPSSTARPTTTSGATSGRPTTAPTPSRASPSRESKYQYPGANISGPILIPGTGFNKNRDKAFFFFGIEWWRQQVDTGSSFAVVPTAGPAAWQFQRTIKAARTSTRTTTVNIPSGFPGAGTPAPNNDLAPYIDPMGQTLINLYPLPNYNDPNNRYNYVYNALTQQNTTQMTLRLDYNFSDSTKAYVRIAQDKGQVNQARGLWWAPSNYELPTTLDNAQLGRSAFVEPDERALAHYHQRVHLQLQQAEARQRARRPEQGLAGRPRAQRLPGLLRTAVPIRAASRSTPGARDSAISGIPPTRQNIFAYNSSLQFADNFTKVLNTHAAKIGFSVEKGNKFQNFQNNAHTAITLGGGWIPGSTGSDCGDLLVGRPAQVESGTALAPATSTPGTSTATCRTPGRSRRT